MNQKQIELKTSPIHKLLLQYSVPAIIGMVVNALYNIVDRMFIGNMIDDPLAMSAVGLTLPFMLITFGFCMLIGIGGASRISISLGENNIKKANHIFGNMFSLIIAIMLFVSIFGTVFKIPILYILGAREDTIDYASSYIQIILLGSVFQGLAYCFNSTMRSEGNPRKAMYTMLIGAGANIVLDPIFIGIFRLGIAGAAWASIISELISSVWVLSHYFSKDSILKFKKEYFKLDTNILKSIISIGMAPFIMQVAASSISTISNNTLLYYGGDLAIGAITIINSIAIFILMPIFGINQGAQPIIGFNYGAMQYQRSKKAWQLATISATIICTVGYIIIQLFPTQLIRTFTPNEELISLGVHGIRRLLLVLPIIGFQIVSANYFLAIGKAKISMILSMLRQIIILIPLLLILPNIWGYDGVFYAYPISDLVSCLITGYFIFNEIKKLPSSNLPLQPTTTDSLSKN